MSSLQRIVLPVLVVIAVLFAATFTYAQNYPNRPIRVITPEPGGLPDILARAIAQAIGGNLGQSVIVDNRPTQVLGVDLATAKPDGYTVMLGSGFVWLTPLVEATAYDPNTAFAPISLIVKYPLVLVGHASVPLKSVRELIDYAKLNPGKLNFAASATLGSEARLAAELLKSMAGIDFATIPYRGAGPSLIAVLANEAQFTFISPTAANGPVRDGKLRALAVTSLQPSPLAPGLPTVASAGLVGYEVELLVGFLAPQGTPQPVIARLNQAIVGALVNPALREKLAGMGVEPIGSSAAEFGARIKSEIAKWDAVIKSKLTSK